MLSVIITVVIAHFLSLLSPGPDFLIVLKSAVSNTKRVALGTAIGISLANAAYVFMCIIGISIVLAKSTLFMFILKIMGGCFLIYLFMSSIKAGETTIEVFSFDTLPPRTSTFKKEFIKGFFTGILNPKNLIFYLSLFSLVITDEVSFILKVYLGVWMVFLGFVWDTLLILLLSKKYVRNRLSNHSLLISRLSALFLGAIGTKLIYSAIVAEFKF